MGTVIRLFRGQFHVTGRSVFTDTGVEVCPLDIHKTQLGASAGLRVPIQLAFPNRCGCCTDHGPQSLKRGGRCKVRLAGVVLRPQLARDLAKHVHACPSRPRPGPWKKAARKIDYPLRSRACHARADTAERPQPGAQWGAQAAQQENGRTARRHRGWTLRHALSSWPSQGFATSTPAAARATAFHR